ncbi:MAG: hypothetical protein WAX67_00305 [Rugosibacter sp.]
MTYCLKVGADESALMKQLVRPLHSKKGQDLCKARTLPASLWMRYKAVGQKTPSSP